MSESNEEGRLTQSTSKERRSTLEQVRRASLCERRQTCEGLPSKGSMCSSTSTDECYITLNSGSAKPGPDDTPDGSQGSDASTRGIGNIRLFNQIRSTLTGSRLKVAEHMTLQKLTQSRQQQLGRNRKRIYSVDCNANVLRFLYTEVIEEDGTIDQPVVNSFYNDDMEYSSSAENMHKTALAMQQKQQEESEKIRRDKIDLASGMLCALYCILACLALAVVSNSVYITKRMKSMDKVCYPAYSTNTTQCWF